MEELGSSRLMALRRFKTVEKRLQQQPNYKQQYQAFMEEYESLGHMTKVEVSLEDEISDKWNYLPHHFVIKESSTTTSLRVVFDASAKTASGISLNDKLMVGPKLQDDIFDIIIRFRCHAIALSADITKMYRQIWIRKEDREWQYILWRSAPTQPIQIYRLNTVTYGTAAGPFLAVRVLHQLAWDEYDTYPLAAKITHRDFYMDDLMSGADTMQEAVEVCEQLNKLMKCGGFEIRKWASNEPSVLNTLPLGLRAVDLMQPITMDQDRSIKTLGIQWNSQKDIFSFSVNIPSTKVELTKRRLISDIAKLFDPMGWLAPIVIKAKIMLQQLWLCRLDWDCPVPENISKQWLMFVHQMNKVSNFHIPRYIQCAKVIELQLHGFCDASQQGYGAVIYTRAITRDHIRVHLLCAKSRVAPVKTVSLPRLELCAAVLLTRLVTRVLKALVIKVDGIYAWSDSTITLAWIASQPARWKTFVANRVSEIQSSLPPQLWHHVSTKNNPADLASRGIMPEGLIHNRLWWYGPQYLQEQEVNWPREPNITQPTNLEERGKQSFAVLINQSWPLFSRISSFSRLLIIVAYCIRFIRNIKVNVTERRSGPIENTECAEALRKCIYVAQQEQLSELYDLLCRGGEKRNTFQILAPFIDNNKLIRVGGRIHAANLSYEQRHPYLLPSKHPLTNLIIDYYHKILLHPGNELLLSTLRQKFWIVNARAIIRAYTHRCISCFRNRPKPMTQPMGNLPASRVREVRPFLQTGVDYGGPLLMKNHKGRGSRLSKCYIAAFICMVTKAIHVELVTDLSTQAFIAAFRRFIGRRGYCTEMYSDNATNFVGAERELSKLRKLINKDTTGGPLYNELQRIGVKWHFIPPSAPHFGGLWEAGIKSVKTQLRRIVGNTPLTYEELLTVLIQIEACLNSRPLTPTSNDPNDFEVLTPGHFLIGEPLITISEPSLQKINRGRLNRWQLLQQLTQHFWKRWSNEYLSNLQQRYKWGATNSDIKVGEMVLIKEDNLPPLQWKLGRILEVHPGEDGITRVVTIKTQCGKLTRPIVKLCKLPISD